MRLAENPHVLQLSQRRAGSTTVFRAVTAHPDIMRGPNEPFSYFTRYSPAFIDKSDHHAPMNFSGENDFDNSTLHVDDNPQDTWWFRHLEHYFSPEGHHSNKVTYGKETFASLQLGFILAMCKDMTTVYLSRDPRGIAGSVKEKGLFNKWNIPQIYRFIEDTVNSNPALNDLYHQVIENTDYDSWVDVLTRKMIIYRLELERHLKDKENNLNVNFEQFMENPKNVLGSIFTWLGLKVDEETLNHALQLTGEEQPQQKVMHPLYYKGHPYQWMSILSDEEEDHIIETFQKFGITLPLLDRKSIREEVQDLRGNVKPKETPVRNDFFLINEDLASAKSRQDVINEIENNLTLINYIEPFNLNKFLTTNNQYRVFLNWLEENGINHNQNRQLFYNEFRGKIKNKNGNWNIKTESADHPVVSVTWLGALMFAFWSNTRLPTFDEWRSAYGIESRPLTTDQANYDHAYNGTTPVELFPPNKNGIFDMMGNTGEWTDTFLSPVEVRTPGGSWEHTGFIMNNSFNDVAIPTISDKNLGFRVAASIDKTDPLSDMETAKRIRSAIDYLSDKKIVKTSLEESYINIRKILYTNPDQI